MTYFLPVLPIIITVFGVGCRNPVNSPAMNQGFESISKMQINQLVMHAEFYKLQYGHYPDSLVQLRETDKLVPFTDAAVGMKIRAHDYYNYKKMGENYVLFSSGMDGVPGTKDDFYPEIEIPDSSKIRLKKNSQSPCFRYLSSYDYKNNIVSKAISFLLFILLAIGSVAQDFEGKIVYQNSYKSKMASMTDEQFNLMMGITQEYYIKGGNYKSMFNGKLVQWQLYINKDNKLFNKLSNAETVLWNDGAITADSVIKSEINKDAVEILGYKCDELILICKSGVQKYYYTAKFPVDVKLYANHKYGNWYEFLLRAKALPLKSIIDNQQFYVESIATSITPVKLESSFFEFPAGSKTTKSPY